jgi:hypothetical protein
MGAASGCVPRPPSLQVREAHPHGQQSAAKGSSTTIYLSIYRCEWLRSSPAVTTGERGAPPRTAVRSERKLDHYLSIYLSLRVAAFLARRHYR